MALRNKPDTEFLLRRKLSEFIIRHVLESKADNGSSRRLFCRREHLHSIAEIHELFLQMRRQSTAASDDVSDSNMIEKIYRRTEANINCGILSCKIVAMSRRHIAFEFRRVDRYIPADIGISADPMRLQHVEHFLANIEEAGSLGPADPLVTAGGIKITANIPEIEHRHSRSMRTIEK